MICQAHTEDFEWIINNLKPAVKKGTYYFNAQFIAILLRIGDYLDIDDQRAPLYLYKYLKPKDFSNLEWRQHFSIENYNKIQFNEKTGLKEISFEGYSNDPIIHRKLLKYFDGLNNELVYAVRLSEKYSNSKYLLSLRTDVIDKIDTKDFTFSNYRLTLDYNAITNLLMGENIYGHKKCGLREIIQNSIDACKTMLELSETHPNYQFQKYVPSIKIIINEDEKKVIIVDNGTGMSVDVLKKYFLNVGVSYYRSDDYILQGRKYSPIGNYGIGFLACFMLSDKVVVNTRYIDDSKSARIELEKASEYICLTYENRIMEQGTSITLEYDSFMAVFQNNIKSVREFVQSNFLDCDVDFQINVITDSISRIETCEMKKAEHVFDAPICLNKYLNGIEVYIEGSFKCLGFKKNIQDFNSFDTFYYDIDENSLMPERDYLYDIRKFVHDGIIKFISLPIIDQYDEDEFMKAYEVLDDFDGAIDKTGIGRWINIIPISSGVELYDEMLLDSFGVIIGEYQFDSFCADFQHSNSVPTKTALEENLVIVDKRCMNLLQYHENIMFHKYWFTTKEEVYLKNILLGGCKIIVPYLADGIRLENAVVNIKNTNFIPNVARNNISEEQRKELSYAIGKAIHLWILDNICLGEEEKEVLKLFISKCYPHNNYCLNETNIL